MMAKERKISRPYDAKYGVVFLGKRLAMGCLRLRFAKIWGSRIRRLECPGE